MFRERDEGVESVCLSVGASFGTAAAPIALWYIINKWMKWKFTEAFALFFCALLDYRRGLINSVVDHWLELFIGYIYSFI